MSESIVLTVNVVIPNGPKMTLNRTLAVDAYDKVEVTVPAGASDMEVELLPSTATGRVDFLLVSSDWYGSALSYKVNAAAGTAFSLDQPHLLTGRGAIAMLDAAAPAKLLFGNTTSGVTALDAKVQILIGRDATP